MAQAGNCIASFALTYGVGWRAIDISTIAHATSKQPRIPSSQEADAEKPAGREYSGIQSAPVLTWG